MDQDDETQGRSQPGPTPAEGIRIIRPDKQSIDLTQPLFKSDPADDTRGPRRAVATQAPEGLDDTGVIEVSPRRPPGPPPADVGASAASQRRRRAASARTRSARAGRARLRGMLGRVGQAWASSQSVDPPGRPAGDTPAGVSPPTSAGTLRDAPADEVEGVSRQPVAVAADRGADEPRESIGTGAGDELGDLESSPGLGAGRSFELGGSDDPTADTGQFSTALPKPPPSRPGEPPPTTSPRQGRPRGSDVRTRILTGVGIGLVAVIMLKLGSLTSLILVLAVATPAAAELFGALRRAGYRPATLVGLVATVGIGIGAYMKGEAAIPLVLSLVVVFTLLWYLVGVVKDRPTINVGITFLGFMWVGFLGSFAALLLDPRIFPNRHGVALLLGAVVTTVGYDIGCFLVGARFGRHRLAPSISPNKTWEGLIGGTIASLLIGAVVVSQISPWTTARGIALGLVVAVAAPLGDLCESLLKRDIGIKDIGWVLPGHGGVLDRVDALLFVVPATYYLVRLINFGG